MGLKVVKKITRTVVEEKPQKPARELPTDEYEEEFEPLELEVDESSKLVISVKRGGEYGLPRLDVRHYATTERFTGFTKKGINIPIELIYDLIENLKEAADKSEEKKLL